MYKKQVIRLHGEWQLNSIQSFLQEYSVVNAFIGHLKQVAVSPAAFSNREGRVTLPILQTNVNISLSQ